MSISIIIEKIFWKELMVGEKSFKETGEWLPQDSIDSIKNIKLQLKDH